MKLTAASQMLDLLMWKNDVLAIFVTGDLKNLIKGSAWENERPRSGLVSTLNYLTCCLAWMTLTLKASTALRPMSSR